MFEQQNSIYCLKKGAECEFQVVSCRVMPQQPLAGRGLTML